MLRVPVRGRGGRRGPVLVAAAVLAGVSLWLTGCSAPSAAGGQVGGGRQTPPAPAPSLIIEGKVTYRAPVTLTVTGGALTGLTVTGPGGELGGELTDRSWTSGDAPKPGVTYTARATVNDSAGASRTATAEFAVPKVPEKEKLRFTVTPDDGETVGIGQPIVVRWATPVTERADVERVLRIDARTPAGDDVEGSWHWVSSRQVDWRPKEFWEPGTKVNLGMAIAGVKASSGHYGRVNYSEDFTIGDSHVTRVDAGTDRVKVYRDGELVHTWPTGTGKPGLETYSGTYVVLSKAKEVEMDSCSAGITCDEQNPDYYSGAEYWATRITASGTFLHAASWDGQLGRANTSHGCIHLSDADAKDFYEHAVAGDVVIVKNSGRGPQERIATQDPGLYDWNLSWSAWTAGSAL